MRKTLTMQFNDMHIIGHRGARGEAPENTLAGFQLAIDAGVSGIELDVRVSADGHLIVLHDPKVDRTTWHRGPVRGFTMAELGLLDARRNTPGWHMKTGVPSLEEVVAMAPADMAFQFEVKPDRRPVMHRLAHNLVKFVRDHQMAKRVVITSQHGGFLRMIADMDSSLSRGYVAQYRYQQPLRRSRALGCQWLIANYSLVNERLVAKARRREINLSVWTVNDLDEADRLHRLGIKSIITDYPTRFLAHFQRHAESLQEKPR